MKKTIIFIIVTSIIATIHPLVTTIPIIVIQLALPLICQTMKKLY
jgi:hypothetical protein